MDWGTTMAKLTLGEVLAKINKGESLAGKDLSGLDLSGQDLSGVNLCGANLSNANLAEANLREAFLDDAKLIGVNFYRAILGMGLFGGAYLRKADLRNSDLRYADLSNSNLTYADLYMATLIGANLRECDLRSANFTRADLSGANLTGANIENIRCNNWKIDDIICEHIYISNSKDKKEWKNTCRNFHHGELEQILKDFRLELTLKEEYHPVGLNISQESNKLLFSDMLVANRVNEPRNQLASIENMSLIDNNLRQNWLVRLIQRVLKRQAHIPIMINGNNNVVNIINVDNSKYHENNIYNICLQVRPFFETVLNGLEDENVLLNTLIQGEEKLRTEWEKLSSQERSKLESKLRDEFKNMLERMEMAHGRKDKSKLKKTLNWIRREGYDFSKNVLAQVIAGAIKSHLGM